MRKGIVFLLLIFVLAVPAFSSGSGEAAPASREKTVITIWEHTPQFELPLKNAVARFMELNPNIKVEYEIKTPENYLSLLTTAIQAGAAPDLFWHHGTATTDMENFYKQGALMELTPYLDVEGYSEMSMAKVRYNGKIYQTPAATIDTRACYYDKDLFAKKGWAIPKTFSEFEAFLPVIEAEGLIPISLAGRDNWDTLFLFEPVLAAMHPDWIQEAAVGKAKIDDPRVVSAMEKVIDWGKKGYFGDKFLGVNDAGQLLSFSMGEAAMTVAGSWCADTLKKNNPEMKIGAFQIPTSNGRSPIVLTYAAGFSVYSKTAKKEAAIRLAQFLTTKESQQIWVNGLGAIAGLKGIKSGSALADEIANANLELESFYNILVLYRAKDKSPTSVWEEGNINLFAGRVDPKAFVKTLDDLMAYPGK
ncbi:MAG: extracellular solute-binding protein [Spirochaetes bacterium]|nr:extracellular solute-binding protein [Spirochaetota bacterium]